MSAPVVVLIKSNDCQHCHNLSKIWDNVLDQLKTVRSDIRTFVLSLKDRSGIFDLQNSPKDLTRYMAWFPMVLLVPGNVWDASLRELGPENSVIIKDGVQILNGTFKDGRLSPLSKYNTRQPEEFARWLKDALNDDEFKKVQSSPYMGKIFPQPIKPFIPDIIKPTVPMGAPQSTNYVKSAEGTGDICSLRIISRP